MEQKRVIWIAATTGAFLIIVIIAGFVLYSPTQKTPSIASMPGQNDTWVVPPQPAEQAISELNVTAETTNVYSDAVTTFNINPEGNDITTVGGTTPADATASTQGNNEIAKQQPATVEIVPTRATGKQEVVRPASTQAAKPPVQEVEKPKVTVTEYWIQAAAPTERRFAESAREKLATNKISSDIFTTQKDGVTYYRVRIGPYKTKTEAEYWLNLVQEDPTFKASYITEVKTRR